VIVTQVVDRARSLVHSLEEMSVRSLWFARSSVTLAAYLMLLATGINEPLSMLLDEGSKLLFIAYNLVAAESIQLKARFGSFFFFSFDRLRASAFKVGRALYLARNVQL
jgi:hypothetical protein